MSNEEQLIAELISVKQQLNSAEKILNSINEELNRSDMASIWSGSSLHNKIFEYFASITKIRRV